MHDTALNCFCMTYEPVLFEKLITAKSLTLRIDACFLVQQYFGRKRLMKISCMDSREI